VRLALLVLFCAAASASLHAADPAGIEFFESKIRPVLVKHCYECHSAEGKSVKGGLRLDTAAGLRTGGDSGPSIVDRKPDESVLLDALRYETYEMPPAGKLPEEVIRDFERWIAMGTPDPRQGDAVRPAAKTEIDVAAGRSFWAFQPAESHVVPGVQDRAWPRTWIDRFVLSRLEERKLSPQKDADRATLLRRISFDLVGLPPAEADLERLLYGDDEQAIDNYIEELLDSPQFGEHWGRHWLDVARYADSNGGDFNATFHEAWRYRNYVIDALNRDRSFQDLIVEQIAGDLLPARGDVERERQLVATGFLMIGTKMLSERDKEKLRMDVVDEQVSAIGSAFLGMTLGCARCHDHKFDPIPTRDYYALAGILRSTQTLDGEIQKYVSNWVRQPLPIDPAHAAALKAHEKATQELKGRLKTAEEALKTLETSTSRTTAMGLGTTVDDADDSTEIVGQWKSSNLSKEFVGKGYIHDDRQDKGQKRVTFRAALPADGEYEVRIAYPGSNGRATNVPVTIRHADGESVVKVDQSKVAPIERLLKPIGTFRFTVGQKAEVTISNADTDGYVIVDAVQFVSKQDLDRDATQPPAELAAKVQQAKAQVDSLKKDLKELTAKAPPPAPLALAVNDAPQRGDCNICIRGETNMLGPKVPRGFLSVASFDESPAIPAEESGRLALARWVADPRNPLTARVYVNRVWHHLMGAGLVRSVDNFGTLGERPTHLELLDQLAVEFVAHNWSTKWLVRTILESRVYRQSSEHLEAHWQADPENKLLWRANRKRIPAEALQDTLLLAGGQLDTRRTESPVADLGTLVTKNGAEEGGYEGRSSQVRAIYQPVIRNELSSLMRVFDFADPDFVTGERTETNVPAQALWMLNGEFVSRQAGYVIERAFTRPLSTTGERIEQVYLATLGRPPSIEESRVAQKFLEKALPTDGNEKASKQAWSDLVHALFASSSFRMLD